MNFDTRFFFFFLWGHILTSTTNNFDVKFFFLLFGCFSIGRSSRFPLYHIIARKSASHRSSGSHMDYRLQFAIGSSKLLKTNLAETGLEYSLICGFRHKINSMLTNLFRNIKIIMVNGDSAYKLFLYRWSEGLNFLWGCPKNFPLFSCLFYPLLSHFTVVLIMDKELGNSRLEYFLVNRNPQQGPEP